MTGSQNKTCLPQILEFMVILLNYSLNFMSLMIMGDVWGYDAVKFLVGRYTCVCLQSRTTGGKGNEFQVHRYMEMIIKELNSALLRLV